MYFSISFFFFFKQKTAYELRISDWSSDVCSSDLLVDDDDILRKSLAEQLHLHEEFVTIGAPTATAALEAVRREHFDIVLLDVGLPDMDGREACRLLRRSGLSVPLIMLTGADSEDRKSTRLNPSH